MRSSSFWSFLTPTRIAVLAGAAVAIAPRIASAQTVVFAEDWQSGNSAWTHPFDAFEVTTATDAAMCSSVFQRETHPASQGRAFMNHGVPVTPGQAYCLTAWVRGSTGSEPFIGLQISDQAGNGTAVEHWLIGAEDAFDDGYGGTATKVTADDAWHWYTKDFTPTAGEDFVIIKDEIYQGDDGTLTGTGDFDDLTIWKGACPATPTGSMHAACAAPKGACDNETGTCVECTQTTNTCSGNKPACDDSGARRECAKADQNADLTITCPPGTFIDTVEFASYGTPDGTCGAFTKSAAAMCDSTDSMTVIHDACVNNNACTVTADDTTFPMSTCTDLTRLYVQVTCNAGGGETCVACAGDHGANSGADCPTTANPICLGTGACGQCSATNMTACTGSKPFCDTNTGMCIGCNGNNGTTATHPCGAAQPFCNMGTGVCSANCVADADCGTGHFCANGTCAAQLANGDAIPTVANHTPILNGQCSIDVGTAVCLSGVCDTNNNQCGFANQDGPCTTNAQCDSMKCNTTSNKCVACLLDTDCTVTQYCNGTTGTCAAKLANGTTCARDGECVSKGCGTDLKCGRTDGEACTASSECRTSQCLMSFCGGPPDAGTDAGPPDAGTDAGPADAGSDAGTTTTDAGSDAGTTPPPAGDDAGTTPPPSDTDAGDDAGAGGGGDDDGGGCAVRGSAGTFGAGESGAGLFGLAAAVVALGRRRRRADRA